MVIILWNHARELLCHHNWNKSELISYSNSSCFKRKITCYLLNINVQWYTFIFVYIHETNLIEFWYNCFYELYFLFMIYKLNYIFGRKFHRYKSMTIVLNVPLQWFLRLLFQLIEYIIVIHLIAKIMTLL